MLSTAVPADIVPIPPSQLTAVASSQIQEWPAQYAVDGNLLEPGWHSASYSNPNEYLRVDVGSSKTIAGITYTPRQMASADRYDGTWNGVIKDYAILVSNSPTFPYSSPIAQGSWTWPNGWGTETVIFSVPVIGRYVYLVRIQAYGWYSNTSPGYASAGEVGILENLPTDDATFPKTGSCSSPTTIASSDIAGWEACRATDNLTSDPGWHNASYTEQYAFLRVDLGSSVEVAGVGYMPRQMNSTDINDGTCNGVFKEYEIYVTSSASTAPGDWGPPRATGTWTWPNLQERKEVRFAPVYGRYVIFRRKTAYGWYSDFNPGFASASEVWVYKRATVWLSANSGSNLINGTGTYADPYYGNFDAIIRSLPAACSIKLGPGTYLTQGEPARVGERPLLLPVASTIWKAYQQVSAISGYRDVTILKLNPTVACNPNESSCVLYGGSSAPGMVVSDLTIDCNTPESFTHTHPTPVARNGLMLFGPGSQAIRVRVLKPFGSSHPHGDDKNGAEGFGINLGGIAGNNPPSLDETGKLISQCVVEDFRGNYVSGYLLAGQGVVSGNFALLPMVLRSQHDSYGTIGHPEVRRFFAYTAAWAKNAVFEYNYCYGGARGFWTDTGPMINVSVCNNLFEKVSVGFSFSYDPDKNIVDNSNLVVRNNVFGINGGGHGQAAILLKVQPSNRFVDLLFENNHADYFGSGSLYYPYAPTYPSVTWGNVSAFIQNFQGYVDDGPFPFPAEERFAINVWGPGDEDGPNLIINHRFLGNRFDRRMAVTMRPWPVPLSEDWVNNVFVY